MSMTHTQPLPPLPDGLTGAQLTMAEELGARSAMERCAGMTSPRQINVAARTAVSLHAGRSQSARRRQIIREIITATIAASQS